MIDILGTALCADCVWHQHEKREVEVTLRTTIPSAYIVVAAVDRTTHTITLRR